MPQTAEKYPDRVVPGRLIDPEAFQKSGDALAVALTVLSGDQLYRDRQGDFVVDLDSLVFEKERLTLDYDHNTSEVIGTVGRFAVEPAGLRADAEIFSTRPNDRAADVIARIERKTPYECSPLLMLREATVEEIAAGEETEVNGRRMSNVTVYRNVPVLGIALCPYGTDRHTGVLALNLESQTQKEKEEMADEPKTEEKKEELNVEQTEGDAAYNAHPELEEMISEFGEQKGLEFFRRGLTMEEAGAEDYAELKAARLAAEVDETPPTTPPDEPSKNPDDKETVAALRSQIARNNAQIARLTALFKRGEAVPLSANPAEIETPPKKTFPSAAHAYANRIQKTGIKEKV